jgi:hypothetical protein
MRITVSLYRTEYDQLVELAKAERRPVRDQAAVVIAQKLAELATDPTDVKNAALATA